MCKTLLLALFLMALTAGVKGQGYMSRPVNRAAVWAFFPSTEQTNKNLEYATNMNCGGLAVNDATYRSCGPCGGAAPGKFAVEFYNEGQEIPIDIEIIDPLHADGKYVFELCETDNSFTVTHECFRRKLTWSNTDIVDIPASRSDGLNTYTLKLPNGLQCPHCVLRWKWTDGEDKPCPGSTAGVCHNVVTNCADITIGAKTAVRPPTMLTPTYSSYVSINTGGSSQNLTLDTPPAPSGGSVGGITILNPTGSSTGNGPDDDDVPGTPEKLSLPGAAAVATGAIGLASGNTGLGLALLGIGAFLLLSDRGPGYNPAGFYTPAISGGYQGPIPYGGGVSPIPAQGYPSYAAFSSAPSVYQGAAGFGFQGAGLSPSLPMASSGFVGITPGGQVGMTMAGSGFAPGAQIGLAGVASAPYLGNGASFSSQAAFGTSGFSSVPSAGPVMIPIPAWTQTPPSVSGSSTVMSGGYVPPTVTSFPVATNAGVFTSPSVSSSTWTSGVNTNPASFSSAVVGSPSATSAVSGFQAQTAAFPSLPVLSPVIQQGMVYDGALSYQGVGNVPNAYDVTWPSGNTINANVGIPQSLPTFSSASSGSLSGSQLTYDVSAVQAGGTSLLPTLNHYNFNTAQMPLVSNPSPAGALNSPLVQLQPSMFAPTDVVQQFDKEPLPTVQRETHSSNLQPFVNSGNTGSLAHMTQNDVINVDTSRAATNAVKASWKSAIAQIKKIQKEYMEAEYCHCKTHLNVLTVFCMSKDGDEESCNKYPCYCEGLRKKN